MAEHWDVVATVSGGGNDLTLTLGDFEERPTEEYKQHVKLVAEDQFVFWFGCAHTASAVTVGPHRPEGDDDREVG